MKLIDSIYKPVVEWGIREELLHGDHTGQNLWEPGEVATAQIYAKRRGTIAGLPVAEMTWRLLDSRCEIEQFRDDGDEVEPGAVLMKVTGEAWIFGAGERLALDYLQHLSGIATRARKYVRMVEPYGVGITDARKGIPVIRYLQKYAVAMGELGPTCTACTTRFSSRTTTSRWLVVSRRQWSACVATFSTRSRSKLSARHWIK